MITFVRRATRAIEQWRRRRTAATALTAALYGDYQPARALVERTARRHGALELAAIAGVWADAYLAATPRADVELITPLDKWLAELIAARAGRDHLVFGSLIADVRGPLLWHHLEALLCVAAAARLAQDDPSGVWP